jgi:phosphoenolpyruvate carboxykinase (GTP)
MCPRVFATNYFLKNENGKYMNGILDKKVWVVWAEGRTRGDFEAITTPIGYLPLYNDLKKLFDVELGKEYSEQDYINQFSLRISNLLEKLDRMERMFITERKIPQFFWDILKNQKKQLNLLKEAKGKDIIKPKDFL